MSGSLTGSEFVKLQRDFKYHFDYTHNLSGIDVTYAPTSHTWRQPDYGELVDAPSVIAIPGRSAACPFCVVSTQEVLSVV
jgi:hypothetical protein